jgi:hypothetical protein
MRRTTVSSLLVVTALTAVGLGGAPQGAWAAKVKGSPDRTAPSVTVASPGAGASVAPSFTATGSAADNVTVRKVVVAVDGGTPTTAAGTTSWSWASPSLAPGSHTLRATAYDGAGNTTSVSVTVSVTAPDTTAPSVTITAPASGSTVAGTVQVSGTASDDTAVSSVQVSVDGGALVQAGGTTTWSLALDTTSWTSGTHTLTARAFDTSGNVGTATTTVSVAAAGGTTTTSGSDITLADPNATYELQLLGRGRMAQLGTLTALLYGEQFTSRRGAFFRDASTGTSSYVALPSDTTAGWSNATSVLTSGTDLWVLGGGGPVYLRHYRLSGGAVPTSASLVSTQVLGDADSRTGDLIALRSGGLVVVWHQQEMNAPRGLYVGYLSPTGGWQVLPALTFMPTASSKQIAVQHPADGSVWVFSDPDAWAATGAVHLTESGTGLAVDWTNATYLTKSVLGDVGPEGENPDLAAAPNPAAGTIDLAYQDASTRFFSTSPAVKGAYVSVAHVPASGPVSFLVLPTYVERISGLALSVVGGDTWLSYRPVDPATLAFDQLYVSRATGGTWAPAVRLGQLASSYQPLSYPSGAPLVAARMSDGNVHLHTVG